METRVRVLDNLFVELLIISNRKSKAERFEAQAGAADTKPRNGFVEEQIKDSRKLRNRNIERIACYKS